MTEEVRFKLDENGNGAFFVMDGDEPLGEMEVGNDGNILTVYHTEVSPKAEGKGLGKKMLAAMVDHARKQGWKVVPLCPFVYAQFKRHPDLYADVWQPAGSQERQS